MKNNNKLNNIPKNTLNYNKSNVLNNSGAKKFTDIIIKNKVKNPISNSIGLDKNRSFSKINENENNISINKGNNSFIESNLKVNKQKKRLTVVSDELMNKSSINHSVDKIQKPSTA